MNTLFFYFQRSSLSTQIISMRIFSSLLSNFLIFATILYGQSFTDISQVLPVTSGALVWGDYDNDGDLDILGDDIYINDKGNFTNSIVPFQQANSVLSTVKNMWIDYDNDGDLDIFHVGSGGGFCSVARIYKNDNGTFLKVFENDCGGTRAYSLYFAWGDYNNDSDYDLYVNRYYRISYPNHSYSTGDLFDNDNGNLTMTNKLSTVTGDIAWADYDNDGDLDFCNRINSSGRAKIYRNDKGDFLDTGIILGRVSNFVLWGDYDNDGDLDLLISGEDINSQKRTTIFRNNQGNFIDVLANLLPSDFEYNIPKQADYDNDGDLDIFFTGTDSAQYPVNKVYRNDGVRFTDVTPLNWIHPSDLGDYDNDGDLDILSGGKLYRNEASTPNTPPTSPTGLKSSVENDTVVLSWNQSNDNQTARAALTYNLRVGKSSGGSEIVSPMANHQTGYRRIVGMGNVQLNTSWTIKNLPTGKYYWSVQAIDNAYAGSQFAEEQVFIVGLPKVATGDANPITEISAVLNGTVHPNRTSTVVKFAYGINSAYGDTADAGVVSGSVLVPVSVTIVNLSPGTTYQYRIIGRNNLGQTIGDDKIFTTSLPALPQSLNLSTTVNFPSNPRAGDYKATDYRMVGLPGESNSPVNRFLSGDQGKNWQVYWDNGAAFVEFNNGPEFVFSVGRAFWIIQKGPLNITNTTVPSARLNTNQEFEIDLHAGWNLIANPYDKPVAWSKIQGENKITEQIWSFNGAFSPSASFEPYIGYYYKSKNPDTLKIPYRLYFSTASEVVYQDSTLWRVNITLSSGTLVERATSFGVADEASPQLDKLDFYKPRSVASVPNVVFNRTEWDQKYSFFATDIRPEFKDKESWDFEVQSAQREELKLTFSGIERVPSQFEVYLIDQARSRYVSLREDSLYTFAPAADISKFTVLVGKAEAIKEQLESIPPKELSLGQNYPNPFNPLTAIPISIPVTTEVKIKVYDILGKEVKTLYAGNLTPGRHFFHWDGRDERGNTLATGVYFYRLQAGSLVQTKKLILLR